MQYHRLFTFFQLVLKNFRKTDHVDMCVCVCVYLCQLLSHGPHSLQPHGLPPARFRCPLDSLGKCTRVGCQFLFAGDPPDPGLNPGLPHCRRIFYRLSHQGSPVDIWLEYSPALSPPGNISLKEGKKSFSDLLTQLDCQNQTLSTENFPVIPTGL